MRVTLELEKAQNMEQFKAKNGQRKLYEPYFIELESGALWFEHVRPDMDVQNFVRMIEQGRIWAVKREAEKNQ